MPKDYTPPSKLLEISPAIEDAARVLDNQYNLPAKCGTNSSSSSQGGGPGDGPHYTTSSGTNSSSSGTRRCGTPKCGSG